MSHARPRPTFSRDELIDALDELIEDLVTAGVTARIRIVGGAGLVLVHHLDRGVTHDVDVLSIHPHDEVLAAAKRLAARNGWPGDWINTDVAMYAPDPDYPEPAWEAFAQREGVIIEVATAELLLAMKLRAARGKRDSDDIRVLVDRCGIRSVTEAVELFELHYRAEVLSDRALAALRQLFADE